jgi:hypothetical protein
METETVSETLDANSECTWLIAGEDFNAFRERTHVIVVVFVDRCPTQRYICFLNKLAVEFVIIEIAFLFKLKFKRDSGWK